MNEASWIQPILDRYEAPLLHYAVRLLGDVDRARDAVQETFLGLCRCDRSRIDDHLAAWLFRVCRHRALDIRRKERPVRPLEAAADAIASAEPGPAALLERRQSELHVATLIDGLPDSQREVVHLRFGAGLSYRDIAEVTGHSVSNVGFIIHAAVTAIRAAIAAAERPATAVARGKR